MCPANPKVGSGISVPPDFNHVVIYFLQQGLSEQKASDFFIACESSDWKSLAGKTFRSWKTQAAKYIWEQLEQDPYLRAQYFQAFKG
ncbi:MAG: hypothetical protein EOO89_12920 [Pedobacter sp.]|nr:MAG: hypothetical protein EOO89_12920 [Pedobacter sp.]